MSEVLLSAHELARYFGGVRALDGVDLAVREGEILGLIGPNGAGKSTLFNCIAGALRPSRGRVVFKGRDVTRAGAATHARLGIARTFQLGRLFAGMSVIENVLAGLGIAAYGSLRRSLGGFSSARRREAEALLDRFALAPYRDRTADALPMGVQRRVETARALATGPSVLLLDEPAAGLTHGEAAEYADMVRGIRDGGVAVMVIEHNMPFAMGLVDRLYVLVQGRIIAEGPPDEVRRSPRVIEAYLGSE